MSNNPQAVSDNRQSEGSIGVFDSGVGGLTVFRAIERLLPNENLVYLGDTARIPYGTRSLETVRRYALEDAAFIESRNVKAIVIACNTASALAADLLREKCKVPVLGVIRPGARRAVEQTRNGYIGVIATEATVKAALMSGQSVNFATGSKSSRGRARSLYRSRKKAGPTTR